MKKTIKTSGRHKGITLIALVITIIVLLILAGVTINLALNGGIIGYADNAATETRTTGLEEEEELLNAEQKIADYMGGEISSKELPPSGYTTDGNIRNNYVLHALYDSEGNYDFDSWYTDNGGSKGLVNDSPIILARKDALWGTLESYASSGDVVFHPVFYQFLYTIFYTRPFTAGDMDALDYFWESILGMIASYSSTVDPEEYFLCDNDPEFLSVLEIIRVSFVAVGGNLTYHGDCHGRYDDRNISIV